MSERADWLYDSIFGFLKSPEWTVPIMDYIDKNCTVFDTEEENKFEYTTIHKDFCDVVNSLLEGFLADLGISPEEFAEVCEQNHDSQINEFVFNQILAVDDFTSFKKMMVKRNIELNVQALSMMKMENADAVESTAPAAASVEAAPPAEPAQDDADADMDPDLAEAIRLSQQTFATETEEGDEELKRALAMSMQDTEIMQLRAEQEAAELEHVLAMSKALEEERAAAMAQAEEEERKAQEESAKAAAAAAAAQQAAAAAQAADKAARDAAAAEAMRQAEEAEAKAKAAAKAAQEQKELEKNMESRKKAAAAALPPLAVPPAGGKLPPLPGGGLNLADAQRQQAMQAAMKRRQSTEPAPSPAASTTAAAPALEISEAEMEARRAHLRTHSQLTKEFKAAMSAQREKILQKNAAARQEQLSAYQAQRQVEAKPAPDAPPSPAPAAEPPEGDKANLTKVLAAQMRRDLLNGLK